MANPDLVPYENLLCEHCRQVVVLARAAQEALEKLKAHTSGVAVLPTLPAEIAPTPQPKPWEGRPGKELSREERLAKAKHLLTEPGAHKTSNGTIVAEPWRALPRKQIRASAEKDIQRVIAGKMTQQEWVDKHKYSRSLLVKRLSVLGVVPHKPGRGVSPTYKPPRQVLTEQEILRVVNGEISGNRMAHQKGLPVGTVYRLVQKYAKSKRLRIAPAASTAKKPPPEKKTRKTQYAIDEDDIDRYMAGEVTRNELVDKYGCSNALIWFYATKRAKELGLKYDQMSRTWLRRRPDKQVAMFDAEPEQSEPEAEPEQEQEPEQESSSEDPSREVLQRLNEALQ